MATVRGKKTQQHCITSTQPTYNFFLLHQRNFLEENLNSTKKRSGFYKKYSSVNLGERWWRKKKNVENKNVDTTSTV